MGPGVENVYMVDYVVADESPEGKDFMARAQKILPEDEFKRVNRFSMVGYAGTRVMLEAIKGCGKALTWECTIKDLNGLKNFETKVVAPISYSPDNHFAKQTLMFMKADASTFTLRPVQ
jgi:branched-chain amino acid transport system substrate-binding protein